MENLQTIEDLITSIHKKQEQHSTDRPASKFRSINADIKKVRDCLLQCYEERVQSRGGGFIPDHQTIMAIDYVTVWFFSKKRDGLLLYGRFGTGKTTLLNCIRRLFLTDRQSDQVLFITPSTLIRDMNKPNNEGRLFDRCLYGEVVLIDEAGIEDRSINIWGTKCSPLQEILVHRYDRQYITVMATNLDDEGLQSQYGLRVWDRILESYTRIAYTQDSYRRLNQ